MTRAVLAAIAIASLLVGLMWFLSWISRRQPVPAEVRRKIVHIVMALAITPLPWAFDGPAPAVGLGVACVSFFIAVRRVNALRTSLGPALLDVERPTYGELYFAAGTTLTFVLAGGEALRFVLPVLLLGLADPAATLAGWWVRRGANPSGEGKTLAGSAAFASVTWILTVGTCRLSGVGWTHAVFVATALAPTTAAVEAVCRRGMDNLMIPLAATLLLPVYLDAGIVGQIVHAVFGVSLFAAVGVRLAALGHPASAIQYRLANRVLPPLMRSARSRREGREGLSDRVLNG